MVAGENFHAPGSYRLKIIKGRLEFLFDFNAAVRVAPPVVRVGAPCCGNAVGFGGPTRTGVILVAVVAVIDFGAVDLMREKPDCAYIVGFTERMSMYDKSAARMNKINEAYDRILNPSKYTREDDLSKTAYLFRMSEIRWRASRIQARKTPENQARRPPFWRRRTPGRRA